MLKPTNGRTAVNRVSKFFESTRKFTRKNASRAKSFAHEEPVLSVLLGLGAGLLLGLAWNGRGPKVVFVERSKGKAS